MHAVANGFYQLAGCVEGAFGKRYHSGNSKQHFGSEYRCPTQEECIASTARYLRVTEARVREIRSLCLSDTTQSPKALFAQWIDTLRPQWKREAEAGIALIHELNASTAIAA
jgi:hypothetical protein